MVSVEFNRFINYYKKDPRFAHRTIDRREDREPREFNNSGSAVRYFVNIGSRDNFDWMQSGFLARHTRLGP
jgi:ATP-dependent RNA helicase DeaD